MLLSPDLSQFAMSFCNIAISEASTERSFSAGSRILNKLRSRLSQENVNAELRIIMNFEKPFDPNQEKRNMLKRKLSKNIAKKQAKKYTDIRESFERITSRDNISQSTDYNKLFPEDSITHILHGDIATCGESEVPSQNSNI